MQQTAEIHTFEPSAVPAVVAARPAMGRLAYIDMIRMVLIILVIIVHAAVTYGSAGDWTYVDVGAKDMLAGVLLTILGINSQAFFMALFFFIAGYFTPGAFDRKAPVRFWKDRLIHLAIPLVAYTWLLSRIPNYLDEWRNLGLRESFWKFSLQTFVKDADAGPTWFLFALLGFSAGYTIWRLAARWLHQENSWITRIPVPGTPALLGLGLVMGLAMFLVGQYFPITDTYKAFGTFSMMLAFFPFYVLLFIGGILAYRNHWLELFPARMLRFWAWFSLILFIAFPVFLISTGAIDNGLDGYVSGLGWKTLVTSLWFGLACISYSITLTLWMRDHVKPDNRLAAFASPNTFAVYIIHPLVLVPFTVAISYYTWHPLAKFGLASVFTVVVCYLLAEVLRRIPGLKAVL